MPNPKERTFDEVLDLIEEKGRFLDFTIDVPDALKSHKDVVAAVLKHQRLSLKDLPEPIREQREILTLLATRHGESFSEFPDWARDDEILARLAVKSSYNAFPHVSERLRGQRDFVVFAFSHPISYDTLDHISNPALLEDIEILKLAVKGHDQAYGSVPENLRGHPEILAIVLAGRLTSSRSFDCLPAAQRDDRELALRVLPEEPSCLSYLSERLRDDAEVVRVAVLAQGYALEHASARLRDDKDLVLEVLSNPEFDDAYRMFLGMSGRLKRDRDVVIAVLRKDTRSFSELEAPLRMDPGVIDACLAERLYFSGSVYEDFDASFRADRTVTLRMSAGRGFPLQSVPDSLRSDREIVQNAICSEPQNIKHVPSALTSDVAFMKSLVALNRRVLEHLDPSMKAALCSTTIESTTHHGRRIVYQLVLEDGAVEKNRRAVRRGEVRQGLDTLVSMSDFGAVIYEEDGPVGSYLSVRAIRNFTLVGQFVFFVETNSGSETWQKSLSRGNDRHEFGPVPQPNDDFLKHSVYLVPDGTASLNGAGLEACPRLYFGRVDYLPKGIQLFPNEESYREALTVLNQDRIYGQPRFVRVDESTLRLTDTDVAEIAGAARVFVDGYGWRFLLPHSDGALAALDVLRETSDSDDWRWIQAHAGSLSDFQKTMLRAHFATADFCDDVMAFRA